MNVFAGGVRLFLTVALAFGLFPNPALSAAAAEPPAASGAALAHIRIDNFGQISPVYFRGAQPEGHDYADLAAAGIKTVIDLQEDGLAIEQGLVEGAGMRFH